MALEFKTKHRGKDIPLGCFFFRGGEGRGLDMGTFLDSESLMSLLEDLFQASMVGISSHVIHLTYSYFTVSENSKCISTYSLQGNSDKRKETKFQLA